MQGFVGGGHYGYLYSGLTALARNALVVAGDQEVAIKVKTPTSQEAIAVLKEEIRILKYSHTDLIGPMKGKINDPKVRQTIHTLQTIIKWIKEGYEE